MATIESRPKVSLTEEPEITIGDINDITGTIADKDRYLLNTGGSKINPATEDTLSSINTKITKCDTDNVTSKFQAYDGSTYIPVRIDPSNYGLLTKVVEMPVSSYTTDSISAIANVLELDLGTFTGAGAGSSNDVYPGYKTVTWQINSDSSGTAHDVRLQGSLDNSNWFDLDVSSTTGNEMRHVINKPVRYLRVNVVSMGDASSITVKAFLKDV